MRFFNLKEQCERFQDAQSNNLIQAIELNRGKTFQLPIKMRVNRLHDLNKRRSVTSSNKIEGIEIDSYEGKSIDKVLKVINDSSKPITKSDIEEVLVNLSRSSIEASLSQLLSQDKITIICRGKYSKYFRK